MQCLGMDLNKEYQFVDDILTTPLLLCAQESSTHPHFRTLLASAMFQSAEELHIDVNRPAMATYCSTSTTDAIVDGSATPNESAGAEVRGDTLHRKTLMMRMTPLGAALFGPSLFIWFEFFRISNPRSRTSLVPCWHVCELLSPFRCNYQGKPISILQHIFARFSAESQIKCLDMMLPQDDPRPVEIWLQIGKFGYVLIAD